MHNMKSQFKTQRPKYDIKKISFMVLNKRKIHGDLQA